MTPFGDRLRQARLAFALRRGQDVSKEEAGRAVGMTGAAYGRWEAGAKEPSLATIRTLATFFGVSMGWLTSGEGEMAPPEPPVADDPPAQAPVTRPTPPNPGLIIQPGPSVALPDPSVTRPAPKRRAGGR
jgi:transcriptional regulator with XRE-family HTH domain